MPATPSANIRIAIMQPYLFPYLGYWQLLSAVDRFVILDDVNYINRGWINRNRIAVAGHATWLTVPLQGASQNRLICDIDIAADNGWKSKMLRRVSLAYGHATHAGTGLELFRSWLGGATGNLSSALHDSMVHVASALGVSTTIIPSSRIYPKSGLTGQDRILDICRQERATSYVNLPGGQALYDACAFRDAGIELLFLEPDLHVGGLRSGTDNGAALSILDAMMHNPLSDLASATRHVKLQPAQSKSSQPLELAR